MGGDWGGTEDEAEHTITDLGDRVRRRSVGGGEENREEGVGELHLCYWTKVAIGE